MFGSKFPKKRDLYLGESDSLLRLLFSDIDYFNGDLTDLAISLQDLETRGFSLDIDRISSKKIVSARMLDQKSKAKKPTDRENAYISKFSNSSVNAEVDLDKNKLFSTSYDPMNGNYAHASLKCCPLEQKKRSYYIMARAKLKEHLKQNIVGIDNYPFSH